MSWPVVVSNIKSWYGKEPKSQNRFRSSLRLACIRSTTPAIICAFFSFLSWLQLLLLATAGHRPERLQILYDMSLWRDDTREFGVKHQTTFFACVRGPLCRESGLAVEEE